MEGLGPLFPYIWLKLLSKKREAAAAAEDDDDDDGADLSVYLLAMMESMIRKCSAR